MGNCFKQQIEITEITKEVYDKSIQCDMEFTVVLTDESIEEIERNIDEMLEEEYHEDMMNFIEELIEEQKNIKIDN